MSVNFTKYLIVIMFLIFCAKSEAQEVDSTMQLNLDSKVSKHSLQNNDLIIIRQQLSGQRIKLQRRFNNKNTGDSLASIYKQTVLLEKAIVYFIEMDHKVIVNESSYQKTNVDSELLLARLVYIKAKTWCMEEALHQRVSQIYLDSKGSKSKLDRNIIEVANLTDKVVKSLESAKSFDRLKYRYNQEIVVSNWEHTASKLKKYSSSIDNKDSEYEKRYRSMLSDLYLMIGVLDMF